MLWLILVVFLVAASAAALLAIFACMRSSQISREGQPRTRSDA